MATMIGSLVLALNGSTQMPYPTQWANNDPNKFMCCDCFQILDISECAVDKTDGQKVDVCVLCWIRETQLINEKKNGGTNDCAE